ncbi:MAG: TetR/AcrR family transcriptional regulator [Desulfuromonas sp.]|nr:MAG: TetR/AcrR family transcriptional regulator [Desulfuromonas sp.]
MTRIVKKPEERRREILGAAREIFRSSGYEGATMQALMEKLQVAKGTIYHYFASKEELLEAVVEDLIDEDLQRKQKLIETPDFIALDALAKMRTLQQSALLADENEEILEGLHHASNSAMHTRQLGSYISRLAPLYAGIIEEGCSEGVFATQHPLECAEFLLAGIQFITDIGFFPWSEEQLLRRARAIPSLVAAQLNAPEGSFNFLVSAE